jgi:hypothetical protein
VRCVLTILTVPNHADAREWIFAALATSLCATFIMHVCRDVHVVILVVGTSTHRKVLKL